MAVDCFPSIDRTISMIEPIELHVVTYSLGDNPFLPGESPIQNQTKAEHAFAFV